MAMGELNQLIGKEPGMGLVSKIWTAARRNRAVVFLWILLSASSLVAGPPTIGPELTFRNHATDAAWTDRTNKGLLLKIATLGLFGGTATSRGAPTLSGESAESQKLAEAIMATCADCTLTKRIGKFKLPEYLIQFANGFWLVVAVDPGCVEVQTPPLPLETYEKLASFVQEHLYEPAAKLGLRPPIQQTDGHSNLGALATFDTTIELADFLLDQVTHPELGMGILGSDAYNAPPLALRDPKQVDRFYEILERVRSGEVVTHQQLANLINKEVYIRKGDWSGPHYQGISLKRLSRRGFPIQDAPVELRYTAARGSFADVLLNYELILKRVEFLKRRGSILGTYKKVDRSIQKMDATEKLSRFVIFNLEMGTDWERYKNLIFDEEIARAPIDSFVFGPPDYRQSWTEGEILRYLDDLSSSSWVRERMRTLLADPEMPTSTREKIMKGIEARGLTQHFDAQASQSKTARQATSAKMCRQALAH